jgi:hypothetical protein
MILAAISCFPIIYAAEFHLAIRGKRRAQLGSDLSLHVPQAIAPR